MEKNTELNKIVKSEWDKIVKPDGKNTALTDFVISNLISAPRERGEGPAQVGQGLIIEWEEAKEKVKKSRCNSFAKNHEIGVLDRKIKAMQSWLDTVATC